MGLPAEPKAQVARSSPCTRTRCSSCHEPHATCVTEAERAAGFETGARVEEAMNNKWCLPLSEAGLAFRIVTAAPWRLRAARPLSIRRPQVQAAVTGRSPGKVVLEDHFDVTHDDSGFVLSVGMWELRVDACQGAEVRIGLRHTRYPFVHQRTLAPGDHSRLRAIREIRAFLALALETAGPRPQFAWRSDRTPPIPARCSARTIASGSARSDVN